MANGNGWTDNMPVWARAAGLIGVPSIIALFLVWSFATDMPRLARQVDQIHQDVLYNRKLIEEQNVRADALYRLLQRICSNTAPGDLERQRCFD